ncbi:MAG: hypothetical protein MZW92_59805 [Comamonadaceae bacterium]|nr:hypothetical protein [Comamonadaceae bacterium]
MEGAGGGAARRGHRGVVRARGRLGPGRLQLGPEQRRDPSRGGRTGARTSAAVVARPSEVAQRGAGHACGLGPSPAARATAACPRRRAGRARRREHAGAFQPAQHQVRRRCAPKRRHEVVLAISPVRRP